MAEQPAAAIQAVKAQLTGTPNPSRTACMLAGLKQVRTWGVDLGVGQPIPIKAAYMLYRSALGAPYKVTTDFNTAEARAVFHQLGLKVVNKKPGFWQKLLGSEISIEELPPNFEVGRLYQRKLIHADYAGQQQGGIITPVSDPLVIAITGESGKKHGYHDRWTEEGVFLLFGEGQKGDMTFTKGNLAIRDHVENHRALLLFQAVPKGMLRYLGEFICPDYHTELGTDTDGRARNAIVFHLIPLAAFNVRPGLDGVSPELMDLDLATLRKLALAASGPATKSTPKDTKQAAFRRSATIVAYVLKRAGGVCEGCDMDAPFVRPDGTPYLEAHHIQLLSDGGLDDFRFVAAVCPNCHRAAHYSSDHVTLKKLLQTRIDAKESVGYGTGLRVYRPQ